MLRRLWRHFDPVRHMDDSKPKKRSGHIAAVWNNVMYVWGGYYSENDNGMAEYRHEPDVLWSYNLDQRKWIRQKIKGFVPPQLLASSCTCFNYILVIFGGLTQEGDSNKVYYLDLKHLIWKHISVKGIPPSPRNKLTCCTKNNQIIYFGGYGPAPHEDEIKNGEFTRDHTSEYHVRGWNNHLFALDLDKTSWVTLPNLGLKPSSRAAHASAVVRNKAFIFGGRHGKDRLNDLYSLCLETFTWSTIINPTICPEGRSWHSMTHVSHDTLFVYGGFDTAQNVLYGWLYMVDSNKWTEVHRKSEEPRLWHTACKGAYPGEVVIFGGCEKNIFAEDPKHSDKLTICSLQPKPLLRICLENLSLHRKAWVGKREMLPTSLYYTLSVMAGNGG